jgi:spermidine/putrescine transport system permease protein
MKNPPTKYGFKNYIYLLTNTLHRSVFVKTMMISLLVTFMALALCYPVAYYLSHVASGQRTGVIIMGLMVPYWVNEILRTFAWLMILSQNGLANSILQFLGMTDSPVDFLNTDSGIIIGMIYCYVLFMIFPIYNTLETLDHNQIEAARDLGASWVKIHRSIAIPHAKPGLAVGCIMTFMVAVGTYAVPSILGGTSTLWFTQIIYSWFFDGGNWNQGAAYAFTLLILCVTFVMIMLKMFKVSLEDIAR